jgi:hypothetical protein
MPRYYVNDNAQANGDHEVHEDGCSWLALTKSTTYLGVHDNCRSAVREAKKHYTQTNGCKFCSPACHTQ